MAKACVLKNKKTGNIERVTAANGKESNLFKDLKDMFGSEEMALLAWAKTYTSEFKQWFKDSKAVDENGEPLIVYLDKDNTDNNVFKFGTEKNQDPIYINASDTNVVGDKFEFQNTGDFSNFKKLF